MSHTGVQVNVDCITKFNEFKLRSNHKYIVFKMSDDLKEVVIEKLGQIDATFDEFISSLPDNDCRYGVCSVDYSSSDGERNKMVFLLWAPDCATVKSKMLYAGTKDQMKKALQGLQVSVQGSDRSEITLETVIEKCKSLCG